MEEWRDGELADGLIDSATLHDPPEGTDRLTRLRFAQRSSGVALFHPQRTVPLPTEDREGRLERSRAWDDDQLPSKLKSRDRPDGREPAFAFASARDSPRTPFIRLAELLHAVAFERLTPEFNEPCLQLDWFNPPGSCRSFFRDGAVPDP